MKLRKRKQLRDNLDFVIYDDLLLRKPQLYQLKGLRLAAPAFMHDVRRILEDYFTDYEEYV